MANICILNQQDRIKLVKTLSTELGKKQDITSLSQQVYGYVHHLKHIEKGITQDIVKEALGQASRDSNQTANIYQIILDDFESVIKIRRNKFNDAHTVSFDSSSDFIPKFSAAINQELRTIIENKLQTLSVWDRERGEINEDNKSLNETLFLYKNDLFNKVKEAVYSQLDDNQKRSDLYTILLSKSNYGLYLSVMSLMSEKIDAIKDGSLASIDEAVVAYYLLNNFDDILVKLNPLVEIRMPQLMDTFEYSPNHYKWSTNSAPVQFFEDSESLSSENFDNKFLFKFLQSIPLSNGRFVSQRHIDEITRLMQASMKEYVYADIQETSLISKEGSVEFLSNPNLTVEEKVDRMITYLTSAQSFKSSGIDVQEAAVAIGETLKEYREIYNRQFSTNKYRRAQSYTTRIQLDSRLNFPVQFLEQLKNRGISNFISTNYDGGLNQLTAGVLKVSKQGVKKDIISTIATNLSRGIITPYYLNYTYFDNLTVGDDLNISTDAFVGYVHSYFGLIIDPQIAEDFMSNRANTEALFTFINGLKQFILQELHEERDYTFIVQSLDRYLTNIATTPNYVQVTNVLTKRLSTPIQIYSADGNQLPVFINPALGRDPYITYKAWQQLQLNSNVLYSPNYKKLSLPSNGSKFITQTALWKEHKFSEDIPAVVATQLNVSEISHIAFNHFFLVGLVEQGIFINQTANNSDKSSVHLRIINTDVEFSLEGKKTSIRNARVNDIFNAYQKQFQDYFIKAEENIVESYRLLFDIDVKSIKEVISFIAKSELTESQVREKLLQKKAQGIELDFIKDFHYTTKNGEVGFNPNLWHYITLSHDKSLLVNELKQNYEEWKKYITNNLLIDKRFKDRNYFYKPNGDLTSEGLKFMEIFGYNGDGGLTKFKQFVDAITQVMGVRDGRLIKAPLYWTDIDATFTDILFQKYFFLQQLITEADLQVVQKYPIVYDKGMFWDCKSTPSIDQLLSSETNKYIQASKRNHAPVTTYIPFTQGLKYSVPDKMRVAIFNDVIKPLVNFQGDRHNQEVHDGGGWTNGIFAIYEENSFGALEFKGTKKEIGFLQNKFTNTNFKYADNVITNEVLKNSIGSPCNFLLLFKKMNSTIIAFSDINNFFNSNQQLSYGKTFYKRYGGEYFKYSGISFENNQLIVNWIDTNGNATITSINIENGISVYDLWSLLGGVDTFTNDNGSFAQSNDSMEFTAFLISELAPQVKKQIIAKAFPTSSVKSSQINVNESFDKLTEDTDILSFEADTRTWGIQHRSAFDAEEGDIPYLTQVLASIAFYGNNVDSAQRVYELMATATMQSLQKVIPLMKNPDGSYSLEANQVRTKEFQEKLLKSFQKKLSVSKDISTAHEIVKDCLQEEIKQLPYSDLHIYHKFISDVLTELNRVIRQRFDGGAMVINPSEDIITIYEDAKGRVYLTEDIYDLAVKKYGYNTGTFEEIVNNFLNSPEGHQLFVKSANPNYQVQIGDTVSYIENGQPVKKKIATPMDLWAVTDAYNANFITDVKVLGQVGRNLRPSYIIYTENVIKENGEIVKEQRNYWNHPIVRELITLQLKGNVDEEQLKELKLKKYDLERQLRQQQLEGSGVVYHPGEQMLPKVYKTTHFIGNRTMRQMLDMDVKDLAAEIKVKYKPSDVHRGLRNSDYIQFVGHDKDIIILDFDLLNTQPKDEVRYNLAKKFSVADTITINDIKYLVTKDGEIIFKAFDNDGDTYIYEDEINGKRQIYVLPTIDNKTNFDITSVIDQINSVDGIETYYSHLNRKLKPKLVNQIIYSNSLSEIEKANIFDLRSKLGVNADEFFINWAKDIKTSFELSQYSISARIPSQHFQSFMGMKTVAFLNDTQNNAYVNIWEIWFQGSDFDIDKAYTLMYGMDKSGRLETNKPFREYDFKSLKSLKQSLNYPSPTGKTIEVGVESDAEFTQNVLTDIFSALGWGMKVMSENIGDNVVQFTSLESVQTIIDIIRENGPQAITSKQINDVLIELSNQQDKNVVLTRYLRADEEQNYEWDDVAIQTKFLDSVNNTLYKLVVQLNQYNTSAERGVNNKIANIVYDIITDISNVTWATQPMSSQQFRDIAEKKATYVKLSTFNPTSKFHLQREGSIGKKEVGIFANGVKVVSSLQQYFNQYYNTLKDSSEINETYSFNVELQFFGTDGKPFTGQKDTGLSKKRTFNHFANTLYPGLSLKERLDVDVAQSLSILISLATDHQKELLLQVIESSPELASTFIVLFTLGYSPDEVLTLAMDLYKPINELLQQNRFLGGKKLNVYDAIKLVLEQAEDQYDRKIAEEKAVLDNIRTSYKNLIKVFNIAQEFSVLAQFFKINQGTPATTEFYEFMERLSTSLSNYEHQFSIIHGTDALFNLSQEFDDVAHKELDIRAFLTNKTYQNRIIEYANKLKTAVNIYDVILKHPSYLAQFKATEFIQSTLSELSGKSKLIEEVTKHKRKVETELTTETQEHRFQNLKLSMVRKIFDHEVIKNVLKHKEGRYTFNLSQLNQLLPIELTSQFSTDAINFSLTSSFGINTFVEIVDKIITRLKGSTDFTNNAFIQHIVKKPNYTLGGKPTFTINVDYGADQTIQQQQLQADVQHGFNQLIYLPSGIRNIKNEMISVGEVFYLYDLIVNNNNINGMSKAMTDFDDKTSLGLRQLKIDETKALDNKITSLSPQDPFMIDLFNRIEILSTTSRQGEVTEPVSWGTGERVVMFDFSNEYLFTLQAPFEIKQTHAKIFKLLQDRFGEHNVEIIC